MTKRTRQPRPQPAVKAEPRAPMRLAWDAVMPAESAASSPFEIYKPMPGVIPDGGRTMAMDSNIGNAYTWAQQMSSIYDEGLQFLGYQQLSAMSQRAEYRRPAEIIAREMTRKGWKLQVTGEDDKSKKIDAIEEEFDRLKLTHTITKAVEQDGLFGRSQIFLDLGDDTASPDGRKELITPLKLDDRKLGKGAIKRLTVIEPLWTYPNDYNSNNPFDPTFFKPQTWFVMGTEIHATRLLTIIGRPVSDLLKPAYAFGGLSLTQMAKPYVDNWLRTRQSVSDLLHSFSVMGLKTNLGEILNGGAAEMLRKRVQLFNQTRDNRGLMVLDKETEELFNVSTSLGSLDHLQAQAQEHQSAVTGIPLSILLGITPSGLNASSEGEIRTFYAWVHAQQESVLGEPLNYILKAVQLSLFGEIDPEITLAFEPLWAMNDKELAEVRKVEADTDAIYLQQGVITQQESRARLAGQEDSPYMGLDLSVDLPEPQGDPSQEEDPAIGDDDQERHGAQDEHFEESDHPRKEDGKFTAGAGSSGASQESPQKQNKSAHLKATPRDRWPPHIVSLKLPPAWTDVRISHDPSSALQAVGKDAKGRPQYVYSEAHNLAKSDEKFTRVRELQKQFGGIQKQIEAASVSSNEKTKVLGDCMSLVSKMGIRPGSDTDTGADKKAFGATTLLGRHVVQTKDGVRLQFVGKKGVSLDLPVNDKSLSDMLLNRSQNAGESGKIFEGIGDSDLLDFAHTLGSGDFKTKDFRTHVGTSVALREVQSLDAIPQNEKEYKAATKKIATRVSQILGNTPTIALQSYIDPQVFEPLRARL